MRRLPTGQGGNNVEYYFDCLYQNIASPKQLHAQQKGKDIKSSPIIIDFTFLRDILHNDYELQAMDYRLKTTD